MKISWGTGIFLFYSFFATSLFYQVYKSTQYDHSLVVENYYEQDLAYQATFVKLKNSMDLPQGVKMTFYEGWHLVELAFPEELKDINGTVLFYRPSDKKLDIRLPIRLDCENKMDIMVRELTYGRWHIEVDWKANSTHDKKYLERFDINIPKPIDAKLLAI